MRPTLFAWARALALKCGERWGLPMLMTYSTDPVLWWLVFAILLVVLARNLLGTRGEWLRNKILKRMRGKR